MKKRMINSPISRVGGKRILRGRILDILNQLPCKTFIDAFGGGGWILLGREPGCVVEVFNDLDSALINFFRIVKDSPDDFLKALEWDLVSRETFNLYKAELKNNEELSPVERAAMYYYVIKTSFYGTGELFGISKVRFPRLNFEDLEKKIKDVHTRLKRVTIENLDYRELIKRYDSPGSLFYFDPPYMGATSKRSYCDWFTDADYVEMAKVLKGIKGKFLLSLNEHERFENIYKGYKILHVDVPYSIGRPVKSTELLISNF